MILRVKTVDDIRLDVYLLKQLSDKYNRSYIKKNIVSGRVKVNGKVVLKAGYKIHLSDIIQINVIKDSVQLIDIPIIFENEDVIVVNKPTGILSHSKGPILEESTVSSWALEKLTCLTGNRAGIVHRLDRPTSGVMILAKNINALNFLQKQFSTRKAKKVYYAIVHGIPKELEAIIDIPIARNITNPKSFIVSKNGKTAQTKYKVIKTNHTKQLTLLRLMPFTGRTHQLRVHLSYLNLPILGDTLYNKNEKSAVSRMYLHAYSLEINIPNNLKRKKFVAKLPDEFNSIMNEKDG